MSADHSLARDVAERQAAMFQMFVGPGLFTTRAALAAASRIPASTLKEWAGGATMPFWALAHLRKFLPHEAINMVAEAAGVRLIGTDELPANWDDIAADAATLTADICEARRDGIITPSENERLRKRTRALIAEAQTMVAGE